MPHQTDPWYMSKRIYAAVGALGALVASVLGYSITEADITETLTVVGAAAAAVLAIWSKVREKK